MVVTEETDLAHGDAQRRGLSPAASTAGQAWWSWAVPGTCFFVTLLACLWQNVISNDTHANLFWDAAHYIDSCRGLVVLFGHWLNGDADGALALLPRLAHKLLIDGPVLPVIGALSYAAVGKLPAYSNLVVVVLVQALLQSLGALLACILAVRVTGSGRWGLCGGLAWGLYPPAVIVAGYFMSETLTTVMLLALVLLASNLVLAQAYSRSYLPVLGRAVTFGALLGLLLLTKPALMFAGVWVGMVAAVLSCAKRQLWLIALGAVVGFCATVAPWAAFTRCTTGHMYFAPQRVPTHNIVMGFDVETDGVGTGPGSAFDVLFSDAEGPLLTAVALWKAYPTELTSLFLRKPERLWSIPWNDLRRPCWGLPAVCLVWWHQLLLLAGLLGSIAVLASRQSSSRSGLGADLVAWSALGIFLSHLIYVLFESIPRYGFTAMPFVILLALYWLGGMVRHRVNRRQLLLLAVPVACWLLIAVDLTPFLVPVTRSLASAVWVQTALKAVTILAAAVVVGTALGLPAELKIVRGAAVFVLALFAVFCLGAHALNNNEIREWACKLNGGHTACRRVYIQCNQQIKTYSRTPDWAAVLIDVDRRGAQARVSVNGQVLADGPRSVNWYDSRVDLKVSDLDQKASLLRKSVESMRQWRVIHVPTSWLNLNGPNLIEVESTAAGAATVYGDYPPVNGRRKILSFARSAGKLWTSASSLEERVLSPIPAMQVESLSWLKGPEGRSLADLSPSPGVQTGQYRIHLVLGYKQRPGRLGDRPVPTSVIGKSVITNLRPAQFVSNPDPVASGKTADVKPVERFWQRCEIAVGPQPADSSHLLIRLNGKLRSAGARETASLAFLLKGPGKAEPVNLPGGMHDLAATVLGSRFAISQEVPYWLIDGGLSALQIDVLSTPDIVFQDARLEIQPVKRPDINRDRFFIF